MRTFAWDSLLISFGVNAAEVTSALHSWSHAAFSVRRPASIFTLEISFVQNENRIPYLVASGDASTVTLLSSNRLPRRIPAMNSRNP